ncbi:MAG: hypothetical protein ACREJ3_10000 [Polyangiaceae bacterium]
MNGRSREAHQRFEERRRREDEAPRLHDAFPGLRTLKLEVEEHRRETTIAETKHVRPILVDRAPALFELPCNDPSCRDGGHDLTDMVTRQLRDHRAEFVLDDVCMGDVRGAPCGRVIRVLVTATYA